MSREIELWRAVAEDSALLRRAQAVDASDVSAVTSLRRDYPPDAVSTALSLTEARHKAVAKFGDRGQQLVADVAGVEQASGAGVAAYKAQRIGQALNDGSSIADLCCGIGGDSLAHMDAGLDVIAVDRDPLRAWMALQNSRQRLRAVCADVARLGLDGLPIHIDPARRSERTGKRARRLEDYQPGPDVLDALVRRSPACAVKLSPGIDIETLPWPGEIEFISDRSRLVQAVLWCGGFADQVRRATLIDEAGTHTIAGEPEPPIYHSAQRYLYTFDASVERAGLIGQLSSMLDAPSIHPSLGLLTADRVIASQWTTAFELMERLSWRPKRVKQWLAANDGGLVEVKTRGKACDPDTEQRRLRGDGATPYTVFVLRFDTKVQALITRRV